jgi:hypothetical protein
MSTERPSWDKRELPSFFLKWRSAWQGPELKPRHYIDIEGGLRFVLAAAWLFCPETVEYRGCVFLKDRFGPANVDNWFRVLKGSTQHVEITVNAVELWEVFGNTDLVDENRFGEELPQLAMAIGECWQGVLSRRYPDRDVTVQVADEEDRAYGPTITFWTQPAGGPSPGA